MPENARLQHDFAWVAARKLVEIIAPALLPDEQKDAFAEFYSIVRKVISDFDISEQRERFRLKPSRN